ncbi:MAG: response regulator [Chitinispirillales bacterium]|jgi:DNA-binding NtrC family response regulator|nr:response regulator [Chitinispirillales bacterium]
MLTSVKNYPVGCQVTQTTAQRRLLVIDDDHAVLFALKRLFDSPEVEVDTCDSLESAMLLIDSNCYQLVLTDLCFSETVLDAGIEISAYIKSTQPDAKVILWTGSEGHSLKEKAKAARVDFFFQKPLSAQIIKSIMENLYF